MNEFGEPNMGNPSVRFDEGRRDSAPLTIPVSSIRLLSLCLLCQIFFGEHFCGSEGHNGLW